ncbi:MAG: hypothetical protein HZY73_00170 [Micropruina sp.]|nr:MAG: hypothetical protein HZY73_00170 [Micropruina sp.]
MTQYSDPTAPVADGMTGVTPVISDKTPQVGQTLTITKLDLWTPAPDRFTYQWYRGSTAIEGATFASYTVTAADKSAKLKVSVTGEKADYAPVTKTASTSSAVAAGVFTDKPVPSITGEAKVGLTVTVDEGAWVPTPDSFAYQWYRSGTAISGASARSYAIGTADAGKSLTVKVTAVKAGITSASTMSRAVLVQTDDSGDCGWPPSTSRGKTTISRPVVTNRSGPSVCPWWCRRSWVKVPTWWACRRPTRPAGSTSHCGTR